mgnify:FL=1
MTVGIYKFECDYGRSGTLSGIFTATAEQIERLKKQHISLGEALGKHSEVYFEPGELEDHVILVTTDQNAIIYFDRYGLHSGYDLTWYLEDEE